ncbi:hypothetical protein Drorol1_Dr00026157 [Drosera rotundifolia]
MQETFLDSSYTDYTIKTQNDFRKPRLETPYRRASCSIKSLTANIYIPSNQHDWKQMILSAFVLHYNISHQGKKIKRSHHSHGSELPSVLGNDFPSSSSTIAVFTIAP